MTLREIFDSVGTVVKPVPAPEIGQTFHIRTLNLADRDAFEKSPAFDADGKVTDKYRAALLLFSLCDEAGTASLTIDDLDWLIAKLAAMPWTLNVRLARAAQDLNNLEVAVSDAEKN